MQDSWHFEDFLLHLSAKYSSVTIWARAPGTMPYGKSGPGNCITCIKRLNEGLRLQLLEQKPLISSRVILYTKMLKENETEGIIGFVVTFSSLMAFPQLHRGAPGPYRSTLPISWGEFRFRGFLPITRSQQKISRYQHQDLAQDFLNLKINPFFEKLINFVRESFLSFWKGKNTLRPLLRLI